MAPKSERCLLENVQAAQIEAHELIYTVASRILNRMSTEIEQRDFHDLISALGALQRAREYVSKAHPDGERR